MFGEKIKNFASRITGKLDDDLLQGALDYINHNEESLAIEILCDHLVEYGVDLSHEERECLKNLLGDMKTDISVVPFKYLL